MLQLGYLNYIIIDVVVYNVDKIKLRCFYSKLIISFKLIKSFKLILSNKLMIKHVTLKFRKNEKSFNNVNSHRKHKINEFLI